MKRKSLKFKLITGAVTAVLVPVLAIGIVAMQKASRALDALAKEQAVNLAKDLAGMTQLVLKEELKLARELAAGNATLTALEQAAAAGVEGAASEIEALERKLARAMDEIGDDYETLMVTDGRGMILADGSGGQYKGISVAERDYFQLAAKGEGNVATPVKSKVTGNPVAPVCVPVRGRDGDVAGTVVAVLELDFLAARVNSVKVGETGYPFVVDQTGLAIVHPDRNVAFNANVNRLPGMEQIAQRINSRETGVESYRFQGIDKIAGFAPVEVAGWSVVLTQPIDEFMGAIYAIRNFILILAGAFLLLTLASVLLLTRSITLPIMRAVAWLDEGAGQVAAASAQTSAASQSLAEGASESAASLEEMSSSLEEMASMTRQNSDNAAHADNLMKESNKTVQAAGESMSRLADSMSEVSRASAETSKIIKTIDEIAFQTNLLALNAAVEAARAGEAGAGFAVVADEVRNLALRAAEAARNTSGLIETTVTRIQEGTSMAEQAGDDFGRVAQSAAKVGDLIAEIAAASKEQAQGIEQVNKAVAEMDKVTQQNAAHAEESASASEEMNAQSEQLKGVVGDLVVIIQGEGGERLRKDRTGRPQRNGASGAAAAEAVSRSPAGKAPMRKPAEIPPATVIPMEESEFRDF